MCKRKGKATRRRRPVAEERRMSYGVLCRRLDALGGRGKWIGVTSLREGDGKADVAEGLAGVLAARGETSLLISVDGDARATGLPGEADDCLRSIRSEAPCLSRLSVGRWMEGGETKTWEGALSRLDAGFDRVVLELPPVADTVGLVALCPYLDGLVLTVRHRRTPLRHLQDALRRLRMADVPLVGLVYYGCSWSGKEYRLTGM